MAKANKSGENMEQEKQYDILKNSAGNLMIAIRARMDDTVQPKIVYDGGDHALLYRNDENVIMLDYVHPEVRETLADATSVLVIEVRDGAIIREYNVPMKKMKKIPIPADFQKAIV